mmetsp:Transcript_10665/g.23107  ORF Transcript_10665/g.23107 Transcript_10665/m.23107 type:complete len:532 (-) Transcript_10665:137-1732(-)
MVVEGERPSLDETDQCPSDMVGLAFGTVPGTVTCIPATQRTAKYVACDRPHNDKVAALAYSMPLALVASASIDGSVRLWTVDRLHCVRLVEFPAPLTSITFLPSATTLQSASLVVGFAEHACLLPIPVDGTDAQFRIIGLATGFATGPSDRETHRESSDSISNLMWLDDLGALSKEPREIAKKREGALQLSISNALEMKYEDDVVEMGTLQDLKGTPPRRQPNASVSFVAGSKETDTRAALSQKSIPSPISRTPVPSMRTMLNPLRGNNVIAVGELHYPRSLNSKHHSLNHSWFAAESPLHIWEGQPSGQAQGLPLCDGPRESTVRGIVDIYNSAVVTSVGYPDGPSHPAEDEEEDWEKESPKPAAKRNFWDDEEPLPENALYCMLARNELQQMADPNPKVKSRRYKVAPVDKVYSPPRKPFRGPVRQSQKSSELGNPSPGTLSSDRPSKSPASKSTGETRLPPTKPSGPRILTRGELTEKKLLSKASGPQTPGFADVLCSVSVMQRHSAMPSYQSSGGLSSWAKSSRYRR